MSLQRRAPYTNCLLLGVEGLTIIQGGKRGKLHKKQSLKMVSWMSRGLDANLASEILGNCGQAWQEEGEWVSHISGVACGPGQGGSWRRCSLPESWTAGAH